VDSGIDEIGSASRLKILSTITLNNLVMHADQDVCPVIHFLFFFGFACIVNAVEEWIRSCRFPLD